MKNWLSQSKWLLISADEMDANDVKSFIKDQDSRFPQECLAENYYCQENVNAVKRTDGHQKCNVLISYHLRHSCGEGVVPLIKVGDEAVHKELGDRMERTATTASSLEAKQDSVLKLVLSVLVSTVKRMLMLPVQFSAATTKVQTVNGVRQLQALVDKKRVIVTESSIRRDLHLNDAEGTDCLPTANIFEELACMGAKSTAWNEFSSSMASLIICLAKLQSEVIICEDSDHLTYSTLIPIIDQPSSSSQPKKDKPSKKAQRQEAEGRSIEDIDANVDVSLVDETQERQNDDLMFDSKVLEDDVMRVEGKVDGKDDQSKKLDLMRKKNIVLSLMIVLLVKQLLLLHDSAVPITIEEITLAQTLIQIKVAKPKVVTIAATTTTTTRTKDRWVVVEEPSEFRVPQETQPSSSKDKGKDIMIEPEVPLKRKDQIALDKQIARDIQAKLDAELIEEQKLARKQEEEANIALIESWENTQVMMGADRLLAERLQSKEREELTDEEKAKLFMELMEKRRKHFAALRAQEKRNIPPTKA
ncbi:hypothetical protein Tco_0838305 [Tanacetum coccineum]|uniref:Uncharacterized protein n=1 Tax=Tanacetum coccineum TaxID=301880 RepID=A0ABQ5ARP1_9ASTR